MDTMMRRLVTIGTAAALVAGLAAPGCVPRTKTAAMGSPDIDSAVAQADRRLLAEATVNSWSAPSALVARRLMGQYGVPDEIHPESLVWLDNGPWRRTVVRNMLPPYGEKRDLALLEQYIAYPLTPAQATALAVFDGRVAFSERAGELSALSDREEYNYLRLNLAYDVISGRLRADEAPRVYADIVKFAESGKSSPYLFSLRFLPAP